MPTLDELREQALRLSPQERAELAAKLLESLDDDDSEALTQAEIEKAWDEEIERRSREVDEGRAELLTEDEFWKQLEG
ncbi:MAG TPA: addiction module protein [Kofleriaceae bacterium]|nr:addiction module protein [Kofleriaceae bacterium]